MRERERAFCAFHLASSCGMIYGYCSLNALIFWFFLFEKNQKSIVFYFLIFFIFLPFRKKSKTSIFFFDFLICFEKAKKNKKINKI